MESVMTIAVLRRPLPIQAVRFGNEDPLRGIKQALADTIAWCSQKYTVFDRASYLRSLPLAPVSFDFYQEATFQGAMEQVSQRRKQLLQAQGQGTASLPSPLPGKLMVVYPGLSLFDGAATPETEGFLNDEYMPPWDTWVHYEPRKPGQPKGEWDDSLEPFLIAWVPQDMVDKVNRGMAVNPTECTRWLEEVMPALAAQLQSPT